ncbi:MAG: alkaline phosphatase family protein [Cyclobacteriaceae bacterium]|nr:MAG: alkaline phosphatase family protein [Cyclobacteriaceae bacterium]
MKKFLVLALLVVGFYATAQEKPYVILVSFDGFRHDYVAKYNPPNFKKFIEQGAQAEAIIPSFPSKTFPNHYAVVTGLNPGNHGLVDNSFYDRASNEFYGMRKKELVVDPQYYGGVPLWELAKINNMKSASFFWVGSELSDEKRRPDYYFPFDDTVDPRKRVQQVVDWLKLPAADRPHLITLYFSFPDHEGHNFGPNAIETQQAVLRADSLLGELMMGIKATRLPVNVVLISDHGMKELTVEEQTFIFVDELFNRKDRSIKLVNGGTQAHLYFDSKHKKDSVFTLLKKQEKNFTVLKKEEYPASWQYTHERVGDIMIVAHEGFYIREGTRERFLSSAKLGTKMGVHGYDPAVVRDMYGIFYAQGPNIKKGAKVAAFQNIHVYPLIAKILGLPLPVIDGKEEVLGGIYRK